MSKRENEKVIDELRSVERSKRKRQRYCVWVPTQRAEIEKNAAEHGNAPAVTAVGLKYPGLKRLAVSDFKLADMKLNKSKEVADSDITEILRKKTSPLRCYSNT